MNSLYNQGVRQTSSIQTDIARLRSGESTASLHGPLSYCPARMNISYTKQLPGQISASLAALLRTMDDYDSMAKREMMKAKQEKAQMCVRPILD